MQLYPWYLRRLPDKDPPHPSDHEQASDENQKNAQETGNHPSGDAGMATMLGRRRYNLRLRRSFRWDRHIEDNSIPGLESSPHAGSLIDDCPGLGPGLYLDNLNRIVAQTLTGIT